MIEVLVMSDYLLVYLCISAAVGFFFPSRIGYKMSLLWPLLAIVVPVVGVSFFIEWILVKAENILHIPPRR